VFSIRVCFVRFQVSVDAGSQGSGGDLVLYGLPGAPPLDVPAEWPEARRVVVPANSHRVTPRCVVVVRLWI
jgi:hypothetical protein